MIKSTSAAGSISQSGSAAAIDWVLNTFDSNHNLVAAVVPVPWSVTTAGVWTYETGSYTVPPGIAYITFFGQIYQASGTTTARFDDGFIIVGTHYFQPDHLSTRLLTDSGGNVVGQQGHFPFGESWYAQNTTTNWQFTSYQRDNESQNDYALMRSYVNRLARFSSPDPAGLAAVDPTNPQSWNRYAYVSNNPLGFVDPTGLVCNGVDQTNWDTLADGTGIFTVDDCIASGGTWEGPAAGTVITDPTYVTADPLPPPTTITVTADPTYVPWGPDLNGLLTDSSGGGFVGGNSSGAANNLGQKPKVNWFANSNCQFGQLNSKYGAGAAKFVSRFSLLSWTPLASGPSANSIDTILPTIAIEGSKVGSGLLLKLGGASSQSISAFGAATFIPTLLGTAYDAEAKYACKDVTGTSPQVW